MYEPGLERPLRQRYIVLQSIINSWQLGKEVIVCEVETADATENTEEISAGGEEQPMEEFNSPFNDCSLKDTKPSIQKNDSEANDINATEDKTLKDIKMPAKVLKRGRPKGADITVIGLPKKKTKKEGPVILSFSKLSPVEKEQLILRLLTNNLLAAETLAGKSILTINDMSPASEIPDWVQNEDHMNIYRVQRFF